MQYWFDKWIEKRQRAREYFYQCFPACNHTYSLTSEYFKEGSLFKDSPAMIKLKCSECGRELLDKWDIVSQ